MSSYEAVPIIEEALRNEIVVTGGALRLRPATDEQIALNIIAALEAAGFTIVSSADQQVRVGPAE